LFNSEASDGVLVTVLNVHEALCTACDRFQNHMGQYGRLSKVRVANQSGEAALVWLVNGFAACDGDRGLPGRREPRRRGLFDHVVPIRIRGRGLNGRLAGLVEERAPSLRRISSGADTITCPRTRARCILRGGGSRPFIPLGWESEDAGTAVPARGGGRWHYRLVVHLLRLPNVEHTNTVVSEAELSELYLRQCIQSIRRSLARSGLLRPTVPASPLSHYSSQAPTRCSHLP
jgi:hypothetical protein